MIGGDGADTLYGGAGDDVYTGGTVEIPLLIGSNVINDLIPVPQAMMIRLRLTLVRSTLGCR